ncbi:MAG: hypothetical protein ACOCTI_06160 [Phycisphaeraceae bacterium]
MNLRIARFLILLTLLLALPASPAPAQVSAVELDASRSDLVGLQGAVRPGTWAPLRARLDNRGGEYRDVVARWVVEDADGDLAQLERTVPLAPASAGGAPRSTWLYARVPADFQAGDTWTVQVLDAETGEILAADTRVQPLTVLPPEHGVIGLGATTDLGLGPFEQQFTQHEPLTLLRGLDITRLPDAWQGLDLLESLVWTRQGGDPANMPLQAENALRNWVRRGGHLVLVMPPYGQTWTSSGLADLLPVGPDQMRRVEGPPPGWLYGVLPDPPITLDMTAFDVDDDDPGVLLRSEAGDPLVVAGRYGLGRVTMIGVDLTDRRLLDRQLPNGRYRLWHSIFGWQGPVFRPEFVEAEVRAGRMGRPDARAQAELGQFVPALIAMRHAAAPALLLAILLFGLYWLAAGPLGFAVLRRKGWLSQSWLVFVGVVAVFSGLAWGGAWLLRPRHAEIAHFSVIDIAGDARLSRVQSWLSLYIPTFDAADVRLAPAWYPDEDDVGGIGEDANLLFSGELPGIQIDPGGYLEQRAYPVSAARPDDMTVPARGTARQFQLDWLGEAPPQWELVREDVAPRAGELTGELRHGLPAPLENVLVVHTPAADETPRVWRVRNWQPGETLDLATLGQGEPLVRRPVRYEAKRNWDDEGFLGQVMANRPGQRFLGLGSDAPAAVSDNETVSMVEMLSFHSALPPPNFRLTLTDLTRQSANYQRSVGRDLDLTPLTAGRRLLVIGHLPASELPAPLQLQGDRPGSSGWTVVRWIYDLPPGTDPAPPATARTAFPTQD